MLNFVSVAFGANAVRPSTRDELFLCDQHPINFLNTTCHVWNVLLKKFVLVTLNDFGVVIGINTVLGFGGDLSFMGDLTCFEIALIDNGSAPMSDSGYDVVVNARRFGVREPLVVCFEAFTSISRELFARTPLRTAFGPWPKAAGKLIRVPLPVHLIKDIAEEDDPNEEARAQYALC
jgi:hypothetical protein